MPYIFRANGRYFICLYNIAFFNHSLSLSRSDSMQFAGRKMNSWQTNWIIQKIFSVSFFFGVENRIRCSIFCCCRSTNLNGILLIDTHGWMDGWTMVKLKYVCFVCTVHVYTEIVFVFTRSSVVAVFDPHFFLRISSWCFSVCVCWNSQSQTQQYDPIPYLIFRKQKNSNNHVKKSQILLNVLNRLENGFNNFFSIRMLHACHHSANA